MKHELPYIASAILTLAGAYARQYKAPEDDPELEKRQRQVIAKERCHSMAVMLSTDSKVSDAKAEGLIVGTQFTYIFDDGSALQLRSDNPTRMVAMYPTHADVRTCPAEVLRVCACPECVKELDQRFAMGYL